MNQPNQVFAGLTAAYIDLLLIVYLFWCGTEGYQDILGAKFSAFCVICGGYILLMGLLAAEYALIGRLKLPPPLELLKRSSWTQRFVLAYLVLTWASALASPYLPDTILGVSRYEGALTITIYCLCFLLVSAFGRVTKRTLVLFCLAVSAFCCLCLLQLAGWNPFQLYPAGYGYADAYKAYPGAYLGTIGNVDLAAAFLCVVIPVLWVGLVRLRGRPRFLLLIPLALSVTVLLRMSVLAGLVGVLGGGALMVPVVLPLSKKRRCAVLALLLLGLAACAGLLYWRDFGSGLLHELHEVLHGNLEEGFGSGRIHIWKSVLERVPSQLWLGAGPDTMLRAQLEPFTRYDSALGQTIVSQIDTAHNEYLNILFHQGVLALAAYVSALLCAAGHWVRHSPADPVCAMLGGGVLCCCVQAFFGISMCITAPFFWLALALLENRTANRDGRKQSCGKSLSA